MNPAFLDFQTARLFEEVRQPDQEKPPHGVGQELGDEERPCLPVAQQAEPGHLFLRPFRLLVAPDQFQFRRAHALAFVRHIVERNP